MGIYTETNGEGIIKPSFVVEGWAVKVKMPYFTSSLENGKWVNKFHKDKCSTIGYVFDRMDDDMGGHVGDYFWYKSSNGYLWNTKEEAIKGYWKFFESNRKYWEKFGITHEMVYLGVDHIRHEQTIRVLGTD